MGDRTIARRPHRPLCARKAVRYAATVTVPTPESFAKSLVEQLRAAGHEAYYAGGCVRDRILGATPKDYDIATSAKPEDVQRLFPRTVPVGAAFGVVLVLGPVPGLQVEIATFRVEDGYVDGRRPTKVEYADVRRDAERRDFTVNGLYYDPIAEKVLDFVGGQADLRRRVVRCIGEPGKRFGEDKLRMLRAPRFAAQLDFALDEGTARAIRRLAPEIRVVSAERVRDELRRMLTGPRPARAFRLLDELGLLSVVLPEVAAMKGVEQSPEHHPEGDVFVHTMLLLEQLHGAPFELAMGALLHDIGKPSTFQRAPDRIRFHGHDKVGAAMARDIGKRLAMSNAEIDVVVALVANHLRFKDAPQMRVATLKRFVAQPHFDWHLELHRIDCLASHGKLDAYAFCKAAYEEHRKAPPPAERWVTGEDLLARGLAPGPAFAELLRQVEDAILEGTVKNRDEGLAYLDKLLSTKWS